MPGMDPSPLCLHSEWLWKGEEGISPSELSPLHAKVLRYLGEDMSLKLDVNDSRGFDQSTRSQLFMETWSDLAHAALPVADTEPVELKTIRLPERGQDDTCNEVYERCTAGQRVQDDFPEEAKLCSQKLSGGINPNLVEAGDTLQNPFAMTTSNGTGEDSPDPAMELRTMKFPEDEKRSPPLLQAPEPLPPMAQTLRGCFAPEGGWDASPALDDAFELRTMHRIEAAGVDESHEAEIEAGTRPEEVPVSQLEEELAVLESVTFASQGSLRTSLATETIPLESVHAESGSQQAANAWENTTSREIKEAPIPASVSELEGMETEVTTQDALTPKAQASHPGLEEDLQDTVPLSHPNSGSKSEGVAEVRPGVVQESIHSSPANSAVTSVGCSGYQAVAGMPAALSAEDEAVTGLRRRGGVEVVVDLPPVRPLSGVSADTASGGGRPPSGRIANPTASTSAENDSLICLGVRHGLAQRVPSAGRRQSLLKAEAQRRSLSIGRRSVSGMQSNRKLVRNALEHCLKGDANREQREQVLKSFDDDLEKFDRFIILFRSIHTGRHDLRALYGFSEGSWTRVLQLLPSPVSLQERMVTQCLRYDSGGKEFKEVPASQETLSVADAVFFYPQYLQKPRGPP